MKIIFRLASGRTKHCAMYYWHPANRIALVIQEIYVLLVATYVLWPSGNLCASSIQQTDVLLAFIKPMKFCLAKWCTIDIIQLLYYWHPANRCTISIQQTDVLLSFIKPMFCWYPANQCTIGIQQTDVLLTSSKLMYYWHPTIGFTIGIQ